jgi:sec-independent protein translocase protein TatB
MAIQPQIEIATLGISDSIFLMVLALVVFGPRKLPQIGRQIGKLMYEFRKASNDFKFQMEEELRNAEEADRRKKEEAEKQRLLAAGTPPAPPQPFQGGYMNAPAEEPAKEAQQTPGESEGLRIQPPTTGEQIPATAPARMVQNPGALSDQYAEARAPEASQASGATRSSKAERSPEAEPAAHDAGMKAVSGATRDDSPPANQESKHG